MRKTAFYFLFLLLAMQTAVLRAQNFQKQTPKFTLAIFLYQPGGGHSATPGQPEFRKIRVEETNISNEAFFEEGGCLEDQGVFRISVLYNGALLEEKDAAARKKREADAKLERCGTKGFEAKPGDSWTRYLSIVWDYPMCKPGTYEITVSRETDPLHPEKSVTVKSNTLTIVVPEPATCDQ
jgi:hypothetical protein